MKSTSVLRRTHWQHQTGRVQSERWWGWPPEVQWTGAWTPPHPSILSLPGWSMPPWLHLGSENKTDWNSTTWMFMVIHTSLLRDWYWSFADNSQYWDSMLNLLTSNPISIFLQNWILLYCTDLRTHNDVDVYQFKADYGYIYL